MTANLSQAPCSAKDNNVENKTYYLTIFCLLAVFVWFFIKVVDQSYTVSPTECPDTTYIVSVEDVYRVLLVDSHGDTGEVWPARCRNGEWQRGYYDLDEYSAQDTVHLIETLPCDLPLIEEGQQGQYLWYCTLDHLQKPDIKGE